MNQQKLRYFLFLMLAAVLPACTDASAPSSDYPAEKPPVAGLVFASDCDGGNGELYSLLTDGRVKNLTSNSAGDWSPAVSHDGTQLAFTSHRSGNSEIWLMTSTGDRIRNLTDNPAWDYEPSWSNDDRRVAFVSERDGYPEIYVQNIADKQAQQLTFYKSQAHQPTWNPVKPLIAYAAVENGLESLFVINPDGSGKQQLTRSPMRASFPAWFPDGQRLAFIGWLDEQRHGIYILDMQTGSSDLIYKDDGHISHMVVSSDSRWLVFARNDQSGSNIFALDLSREEKQPVSLTAGSCWNDFPALLPVKFQPVSWQPSSPHSEAESKSEPPIYGINLADLSKVRLVRDLGMRWAKNYANWGTIEPQKGRYNWTDIDNIIEAFSAQEVNLLLRVHGTPDWARPAGTMLSYPPSNPADFGRFISTMANRYKGKIKAYEIWNEPNLNYEWGYLPPDPAGYSALLKEAYTAIKAADPSALVITGGLATTGAGSPTAMGDLEFIKGLYASGAKGYFDALGSHPYAYGKPPAMDDPWGLSFDRVSVQHELMVKNGDSQTPVWITEVGWVLRSNWDLGEHEKISVSEEQQAAYISQMFSMVNEWPWLKAVFIFNLDFSTVSWYRSSEPMRWYAILNPDMSPRPAYSAVRNYLRR